MPVIYHASHEESELTSGLNEWKLIYSGTSAGTPAPLPRMLPRQVSTEAHPSVKIASLDTSSGAIIAMEHGKPHGYDNEFVLVYDQLSANPNNQRFNDAPGVVVRVKLSCNDLLNDSENEKTVRHRIPEPSSYELLALQHAADSKNLRGFARLAGIIKWSRFPVYELTRAIDLALMLDMVQVARELAQKGRLLFPRNKRVQQAASVLSPAFWVRTRPAQITNLELFHQWLKDHSSSYKGLWVAVRGGTLLGSAPTLRNLYEQIGPMDRTSDTLIVKVLS